MHIASPDDDESAKNVAKVTDECSAALKPLHMAMCGT